MDCILLCSLSCSRYVSNRFFIQSSWVHSCLLLISCLDRGFVFFLLAHLLSAALRLTALRTVPEIGIIAFTSMYCDNSAISLLSAHLILFFIKIAVRKPSVFLQLPVTYLIYYGFCRYRIPSSYGLRRAGVLSADPAGHPESPDRLMLPYCR